MFYYYEIKGKLLYQSVELGGMVKGNVYRKTRSWLRSMRSPKSHEMVFDASKLVATFMESIEHHSIVNPNVTFQKFDVALADW